MSAKNISIITYNELRYQFKFKLATTLISFCVPFVMGIIFIFDTSDQTLANYHISITSSVALKLFISIFEYESFEKNRLLYTQYSPSWITIGRLIKEWILFFIASMIYIVIVSSTIVPFHEDGGFLMGGWLLSLFFGISYYLVSWIALRVIFCLFRSRPLTIAFQILFISLSWSLGTSLYGLSLPVLLRTTSTRLIRSYWRVSEALKVLKN